jgi:pimeloyl-ACP methyl ester carboxylesterase
MPKKVETLSITSTDGIRIAYDVTGSGPALMLLHGLGKVRRDWHKAGYVERLKGDFTVITVDIRGSGESDLLVDTADYAIEKICQDIDAVADACGLGQFAVWGYSFGGNIARYLGAWSKRVTAVAIIGVPFGPIDENFITDFVNKWAPLVEAYKQGKALSAKERKPIASGQIPTYLACLQAMRAWPSIEPGDVACPALLLSGTKNKAPMDWIEAHRQALEKAGTRVEIVPGLNHLQEFSQIERVFPPVSGFFKEHAR